MSIQMDTDIPDIPAEIAERLREWRTDLGNCEDAEDLLYTALKILDAIDSIIGGGPCK